MVSSFCHRKAEHIDEDLFFRYEYRQFEARMQKKPKSGPGQTDELGSVVTVVVPAVPVAVVVVAVAIVPTASVILLQIKYTLTCDMSQSAEIVTVVVSWLYQTDPVRLDERLRRRGVARYRLYTVCIEKPEPDGQPSMTAWLGETRGLGVSL